MSLAVRSALAALVLIVPVAAELIWPSFGDSGHLLFAGSQLLGLAARRHRRASTGGRRGTRRRPRPAPVAWADDCCSPGAALQILFAPGLRRARRPSTASRLEASFVLFLLGFLAIFVGGLVWGRSAAARRAVLGSPASGVLATAVLGFLAIAVGVDPFHDVFLLSSYAAWVLVGRGLEAPARPSAERSSEVSAASR